MNVSPTCGVYPASLYTSSVPFQPGVAVDHQLVEAAQAGQFDLQDPVRLLSIVPGHGQGAGELPGLTRPELTKLATSNTPLPENRALAADLHGVGLELSAAADMRAPCRSGDDDQLAAGIEQPPCRS